MLSSRRAAVPVVSQACLHGVAYDGPGNTPTTARDPSHNGVEWGSSAPPGLLRRNAGVPHGPNADAVLKGVAGVNARSGRPR
jgi:hypothetical protein